MDASSARRADPLVGLLVLLVHQLAGEAVVRALDLPVPGSVVGLLLLLVTLTVRGRRRDRWRAVETAADGLLRHLALLFVPAGTGVVQYAALLRAEAVPVAVALVLSTATALVATALVLRLLLRRPA